MVRAMATTYVYDFSEGGDLGLELLGGKGVGLAEMTAAEKFWYVVENIFLGAGYFAKIVSVKALSESTQRVTAVEEV